MNQNNNNKQTASALPDFPTSRLPDALTPKQLGYYFPAEWEKHEATWLSWPHKEESWPGKINAIFPSYSLFVKYLAQSEKVRINIVDEAAKAAASKHLSEANVNLAQVEWYYNPTDDAWCRDHGPAFIINPKSERKKSDC